MRVEITDVRRRFGRVEALRGITLEVPAGRRLALVGPNGSGKSTLTRAVMGLVAHEGTILLDGMALASHRPVLGPRLAYVPQVAPRLAAPVDELVRTIAALRGLPSEAIAACASELDLDVAAIRRRPFRDLSGGMKQKLLVAAALASETSLLILDEPTASLDPRARERFFELFERRAGGRTLILCSHRLEELSRLVDHVVLLDDGRVAYEGRASDFLDARATTVIELRVRDGATWLGGDGFVPGHSGWWSRRVDRPAAAAIVRSAVASLGDDVIDVVVRSVETIDERRAPEEARRG